MQDQLRRFSLSMSAKLADQLDAMCKAMGYESRSQAVGDMVRARLIEYRAQTGSREIVGNVTLVYDHHKPNVQKQITGIQHDHGDAIIATMHVHLDHDNCMEVIAVRGRADLVKCLADRLIALKGVKHGELTVTTTGREFHR